MSRGGEKRVYPPAYAECGLLGSFWRLAGRLQQEARVGGHPWPPSLPLVWLWGGLGLLLRLEGEA